jgi:3-hydroxybutyryl-CoA dehydratase
MNHYTFDEMEIGLSESFVADITESKMKMFSELSGDLNPMHVDADYAKSNGYEDKIVYGMLASSLYSTLVGMYLPGEKCLLNKCSVDYRKPVYVGDKLNVYGEVVDKRISTGRIKIKGKMVNQKGITVNTAEITVSFTGGRNG